MKRWIFGLVWSAVLLASCIYCHAVEVVRPTHGEPEAPKEFVRASMLVDTQQLATWLANAKEPNTPKLVLIDARARDEYTAARLPGARNIESDPLQDPDRKPYFLPSADAIKALTERCGIDPDSQVIIYDNHGGRLAARIWFTLWAYGHDKVSILNGGYGKWRGEQRSIESTPPGIVDKSGTWKPSETLRGVITADDLKKFRAVNSTTDIPHTEALDARDYPEYMGLDVRTKWGGHFPGAVNFPWSSNMKMADAAERGGDKQEFLIWKEPSEIHAMFRAACIVPQSPLMVYDQSGGRAAHLLFTLHLMGYTHAVCYYGGWREYGNLPNPEVEK